MAFRIVKDATSWWTVKWNGVDDDGQVVEQSLELRFARLGNAEFMAMFGPDNTTENQALWNRVVRGWRGLQDEAGTDIAWPNDAAVDALLDTANFPAALGLAYMAFMRALPETRLGNSSPSPAGGRAAADPTAAPEATPTP